MKINFQALFTLGEQSRISFREPLKYISSNGIEVTIKDHEDGPGKLIATYEIDAENPESVQSLIETEVTHTASLLSWQRNMPVPSARINGYQFSRKEGTHGTVVLAETIYMTSSVSMMVSLSEEGAEMLATGLSTELSTEAEGIVAAWRDALGKDTDFERFLFLYRLLESLGLPGGVDAWLKKADPSAPFAKTELAMSPIYKFFVTTCTQKKVPFLQRDIKNRLPQLQGLVRAAIIETYPELAT